MERRKFPSNHSGGRVEIIPSQLPFLEAARRGAFRHPSPSVRRDGDPNALRAERILGILRCHLAALGLIAIWIYPADASRLTVFGTGLAIAYLAGAVALHLYISGNAAVPAHLPMLLHAADVGVAAVVTLALGVSSPLFILLIYPVLTGAYRWGMPGALVTALTLEAVILYVLLLTWQSPNDVAFNVEALVLQALSIPVIGGLAGYVAHIEAEKERAGIDLATVLRSARTSGEFDQTVSLVLSSLIKMFGAAEIMLVIADRKSGGTFLWSVKAQHGGLPTNEQLELRPDQRDDYFFDLSGADCLEIHRRLRRVRMFDAFGRRIHKSLPRRPPGEFTRRHPFNHFVCVALQSNDAWTGRLFVLEPRRRVMSSGAALHAQRICRELEPETYRLYHVHRLRTRAQAIERSRIARELHDGVTQSLLGLEMLVAVLRRRTIESAPALDTDLLQIHDLVRENIIALREVTESGHIAETISGNLLADLEEIVVRFQRHSGIMAKFVADGGAVSLTVHRHREVARLVHEGLVNVRKHSGAHRVIVRSTVSGGWWLLSLEDDGRGFSFGGRKTQAQLEYGREGPRTIIERARRLGGEVAVDSRPGCGSRVEIALRLQVD